MQITVADGRIIVKDYSDLAVLVEVKDPAGQRIAQFEVQREDLKRLAKAI